jgi:predicted Zn-dependent protease
VNKNASRSNDEILALLDHAVSCGDEVEGLEALYVGTQGHRMRLAESAIFQSSSVDDATLRIRAVHRGAEACVETNRLSRAAIAESVAQAMAMVKDTPATSAPMRLPESGVGTPENPAVSAEESPGIMELGPGAKAELLADALLAHERDGLALAGRFHTGRQVQAIRSSKGVAGLHAGTYCDVALSSLTRPAGHRGSAHRERLNRSLEAETIRALAEEARAECHQAADPISVDLGGWDVVLAPAAVAELLAWLGYIGFSSDPFEDGTSFVRDRLDQKVTGEAVTLVDDGSMPTGLGLPVPWDVEGQPKVRTPLLEAGIARGIVHNFRSAEAAGCGSTGHAVRRQFSPGGGSSPTHLHFLPGEASLDGLIGQVNRGLYVTRLHYVNGLIEPRRAVMTGLLRDAAFLIEDGRLGKAVSSMRFTDSISEAFERIEGPSAIGSTLSPHGMDYSLDGGVVCPPILIRGLNFSSAR